MSSEKTSAAEPSSAADAEAGTPKADGNVWPVAGPRVGGGRRAEGGERGDGAPAVSVAELLARRKPREESADRVFPAPTSAHVETPDDAKTPDDPATPGDSGASGDDTAPADSPTPDDSETQVLAPVPVEPETAVLEPVAADPRDAVDSTLEVPVVVDPAAPDPAAPDPIAGDPAPSGGAKLWAGIAAQVALGLFVGGGLFFGFGQLWPWSAYFSLFLAVCVIFALVTLVHVVRRSHDLFSLLLALAVGLFVTFGPLVLLLARG